MLKGSIQHNIDTKKDERCEWREGALTGEEVPVAVGLVLALLTVGHGRHLLGGGAAHLLLLSCSPPHSWASHAHLEGRQVGTHRRLVIYP